jgi:outer membrane protein assembly factor BamD (BamD/ComL family)
MPKSLNTQYEKVSSNPLPKELAVKLTRAIYPLIAAATVLAACSSAESDWKKADSQNTTAAYQDFLTQHPNDTHAQEARDRIKKLEDDQAWADAQKANTADSYQQYLQKEPNGAHAQEAHDQVTALERAADWKTAQQANTVAALQGFLQKYSQGPEVEEAKAAVDKLQGYRVQVGAFKDEKSAQKAHDDLQKRFGSDVPGLEVVAPTGTERRHIVASGPMTEDDAQAACAKLKKAHAHCEIVKR